MLTTFVLFMISILLGIIILIWNFDYWTKRGVTSPNPLPNIANYIKALTNKRHMLNYLHQIYRTYKNKEDFVGIYSLRTPQLLILNPQLCQQIYEQNFKHFHDNEISTILDKESKAFFGNNPFMLTGDEWQEARSLLKAGLEIELLKTVSNSTRTACQKLSHSIEEHNRKQPNESVNIRELCLRFTSEVVTDCIYGFRFCGQPTTQFISNAIKSTFNRNLNVSFYLLTTGLVPALKKFYKTRLLPQQIETLLEKLMRTAVELRKAQTVSTNQHGFLNHLLNLQKQKNLTTMDLTTFTTAFMLHGLPAISTVLTHCLELLSEHREKQARLRCEIFQNCNERGEIVWDSLSQLPYLEACVHETIRILTPTYYAAKVCTSPIQLTSKSGCSIRLERGEIVVLPLYSIMNDERFYSNANEFQPERFLGPTGHFILPEGRYYGFGAGPRKCIGEQFALTRMKAAIVAVLSNFQMAIHGRSGNVDTPEPNDYRRLFKGAVCVDFKAINEPLKKI